MQGGISGAKETTGCSEHGGNRFLGGSFREAAHLIGEIKGYLNLWRVGKRLQG